jgi:hypothetical protein
MKWRACQRLHRPEVCVSGDYEAILRFAEEAESSPPNTREPQMRFQSVRHAFSLQRWILVAILTGLALPASLPAQQPVENVAAFARLYGVVRWFYPSDAAAAIDWNRFAVEGVRRVRMAPTPEALETSLRALFTPLGPGIVIGTTLPSDTPPGDRDPELVAWSYRGAGFSELGPGAYSAKRTNRAVRPKGPGQSPPRVISQALATDSIRGHAIRLQGSVRIDDPNLDGWAGLWLRVDREGGAPGFFDNMQGRPVRDTTWREYVIEGPIAEDAVGIMFGALSIGEVSFDLDGMEISVRAPGGDWTPITVPDASFEAAANSGAPGWGISAGSGATRHADGAAHGSQFIRLTPPAVVPLPPEPAADSLETPRSGATVDVTLALGLKARVPMSLTDDAAQTISPALAGLRAELANLGATTGRDDIDVRLADAVVAWSALRHFYPYWEEIAVDWDDRLRPQLQAAIDATPTRAAHYDTMRRLVAELRDGHGNVQDLTTRMRWQLPVQLRQIEGKLVVTATNEPSVPVGSVIVAINGESAASRFQEEMVLSSGTPQWQEARAAMLLTICSPERPVGVSIEHPTGELRDVQLPCDPKVARAIEVRPDSLTEMEPGIWYVDLTRVSAAQLTPLLPRLAAARGVIFDVRGYPTDAGIAVLPHLMREPEDSTASWMQIPRRTRPFGEVTEWVTTSWFLKAESPHVSGKRVFLTDGRAISYAESVLGYVRDHALGTIIGGATAGANGNIASFSVPGGFSIVFTGMRVTRHDGRTPFHAIGVTPDIPLEPTLAGIRAGRDELLQRALEELRK